MTDHDQALLTGDTLALLQWIVAAKGEPRHIGGMPGCFNAKMWASTQRLFKGEKVSHVTFRFYMTPEGVRYLQEHGVSTDEITDIRPYTTETPPEPVKVTAAFAQTGNGPIEQVDLARVPSSVLDTLRGGMLAINNGMLYGLSPEHILGTD